MFLLSLLISGCSITDKSTATKTENGQSSSQSDETAVITEAEKDSSGSVTETESPSSVVNSEETLSETAEDKNYVENSDTVDTNDNNAYSLDKQLDFTLKDLYGNEITLSLLKGKVVMINFWATWCPPCKAEIPDFIEVYSDYKDKNVEFLGICNEGLEEVKSFAEEYNINYPLLIDSKGSVFSAYQINTIPTTFFIGKNGKMGWVQDMRGNTHYKQVGMLIKEQLIATIERMLKQ
jgi:peroxiredoxin